jgi:sodium-dependent phosphate transporter
VHGVIETDSKIAVLHANAEMFDPKAESGFRYLQIFAACPCARSANAANATGPPLCCDLPRHGKSCSRVCRSDSRLGGGDVSSADHGYNIIRAIGIKMITSRSSRGFSIELGSALVAHGSRLELPPVHHAQRSPTSQRVC